MIGYTREDFDAGLIRLEGSDPSEYSHLDEQIIEQLQETGICDMYEKAYRRKDGSTRVRVGGGGPIGRVCHDLAISYVLD